MLLSNRKEVSFNTRRMEANCCGQYKCIYIEAKKNASFLVVKKGSVLLYLDSIMEVKNASFSQLLKTLRMAFSTGSALKRWLLC
jgi:hypothetical protein